MESNFRCDKLPSRTEIIRLFSEVKADSELAELKKYVLLYSRKFTNPKLQEELTTDAEVKLYQHIAGIEPDVFFDTYLPGYCIIAKPFSRLYSFFPGMTLNAKNYLFLLQLIYLLFYLYERFPNECLWFDYHRLLQYPSVSDNLSYEMFCDIWKDFFVMPKVCSFLPDVDYCEINDTILRLGIDSTYKKSLMVLYVVLYRDYRECEHNQKKIEKLRDDFDRIEQFESPQAIFTLKSIDDTKPRFLNRVFENTVPESFKTSDKEKWKSNFSAVLKAFSNCSLDFLINYFIPEIFPSIPTVISFLSEYPSSRNHSSDRKVIEIISAFLFSIESGEPEKVKVFEDYLENKLYRDGLSNHKEIYDELSKLQKSYALINHRDESNYKRIFSKNKSAIINLSNPKSSDKALLEFYADSKNDLVSGAQKLSQIPALNFLNENFDNCKDSKVENGIIFEECANRVMHSSLHKVVLLQPSYSFLLKWLSDYRTKNLETTVVLYDESIVDCLNQKLREHNLISKKLYYTNQDTSYNLHIVNSIDEVSEYDLALSFYNNKMPKNEDLLALSRLLSDNNKLICVLPHKVFEAEENEAFRREILSVADIKSVTYIPSILYGYNPRKKYLVEFCIKDDLNQVLLRLFEIDKSIHGENRNRKNSGSGLYYLTVPTEKTLRFSSQYTGEAIDFLGAYTKRELTNDKATYNRAKKVSFAPDFNVYYNVTNHGKGKQAKCFFAKYLLPKKIISSKKGYGAKIAGSKVVLSAKDDFGLEKKIIDEFAFSNKFEEFRAEAAKEIKSALKEGRLTNISLFSFSFSYTEELKNYSTSFDFKFCYHALCQTSLGSLILNEATQDDFDKAVSDLIGSKKIDSEKLLRQMEILLNCAVKYAVLYNSRNPVFAYFEAEKKKVQTKAQLRDAFTKKSLSFKEEKELIKWLLDHYFDKPAYLGTMIKLFTGMTNPEVSMLRWSDFCKTEYSDCFHLKVTKQRNYKSLNEENLPSPFKYRIVPIPAFLSTLLINQRDRIQKTYRVPFATLLDYPIISDSNECFADYCTPNKLRLNSNKALKEGAQIPEHLLSFPDSDGIKEHDLNRYNGDFFVSNFKFHALNDAMMTQGEVSYILGLVPHDTFSKHYCDYTNPFLQMKLVAKLNDWCSLYYDWEGTPQMESGTTKSDLKCKNIIISPYNSGCASGLLQLSVRKRCSAAIEIAIEGNRGVTGNITTYEENKHEK